MILRNTVFTVFVFILFFMSLNNKANKTLICCFKPVLVCISTMSSRKSSIFRETNVYFLSEMRWEKRYHSHICSICLFCCFSRPLYLLIYCFFVVLSCVGLFLILWPTAFWESYLKCCCWYKITINIPLFPYEASSQLS